MAMSREQLKSLAIELSAAMPPSPPRRVVVTTTGEAFSKEALDIARAYEAASEVQRIALDAMVEAMELQA